MCGIAGIISSGPVLKPDEQERDIRLMTAQLAHRGPDGEGFWNDAAGLVWLGHRRLAIIDTGPAAAQPMCWQDRFTITYNGEIYNYLELRQELVSAGCSFRTQSDTEVLLAAYSQWGADCLGKLDGMFAFAIWDGQERKLFLARDRFGEKPLFFYEDPRGRLLFASEMKALWSLGAPRELEGVQSLLYLATGTTGYALEPSRTIYKQIYQLPAASFLEFQPGSGALPLATRYWDLDKRQSSHLSEEEAVHRFRELLSLSVSRRLRADVPSGTSLSGGVDSGCIAALVKSSKGSDWQSFSAVFPGFDKDESESIRLLVQQLGIRNQPVYTNADDLVKGFEKLVWHQEQPFDSASTLIQFRVFEQAGRSGVKVLLDGQGADEMLGGYRHYIHWYLQELWRSGKWKQQREELRLFRQHGYAGTWGPGNYLAAILPQLTQAGLEYRQLRQLRQIPLVNAEFSAAFQPAQDLFKPLVTQLNDILYYDMVMGKLPELLRYADRNSMAHGRELRLPFLQHELVQFVFSLPAGYKLRQGYTKWILRRTMSGELPAGICWQTRKIAYEPPQEDWMNSPLVGEKVAESKRKLVKEGLLDKKAVERDLAAGGKTAQVHNWRYWVLASLNEPMVMVQPKFTATLNPGTDPEN